MATPSQLRSAPGEPTPGSSGVYRVDPSQLPPQTVGTYLQRQNPATGEQQRRIFIDRSLLAHEAGRVLPHEIGHAISDMAGSIPVDRRIAREIRGVYNTLNNPQRWQASPKLSPALRYGPEQAGYPARDVDQELIAEAIRAYMADPNYLKSVAPKVAARIREYANPNPLTNRAIQFNSALPAAASFGALMPWALPEEGAR